VGDGQFQGAVSVASVLNSFTELTPELYNKARYNPKCKELKKMIENHEAMRAVFAILGVETVSKDGGRGIHDVPQYGPVHLNYSDILQYFNWNSNSYAHKSQWYQYSEVTASRRWNGPGG